MKTFTISGTIFRAPRVPRARASRARVRASASPARSTAARAAHDAAMRALGLALGLTLGLTAAFADARPDPGIAPDAWMADASIRARPLGALILPGAHDAATNWLSPEIQPGSSTQLPKWLAEALKAAERLGIPADQIVRRWARAQTATVGELMARGARYLDVRCGWESSLSEWRVHHALVGRMVDETLEEVKAFLVEHPSELAIVELSHFLGDPDAAAVERLATVVEEIFGDLLAPYPGSTTKLYEMQLGRDFVDQNRRVLIVFEDADVAAKHSFWPAKTITNTYADSDDERFMESFNRDVVVAFNEPSFAEEALLKLSWTLTTQPRTVLEALNVFEPSNPHSLIELASRRANPKLSGFADSATSFRCAVANVIVVDDFVNSDALEVALRLNAAGPFPRGECAWPAPARVASSK